MIKEEYRKMINEREPFIDTPEAEIFDKRIVEFIKNNVEDIIVFLENDSNEDDFGDMSGLFEEIIIATQSKDLVKCWRKLLAKYPEYSAEYNIEAFVNAASELLE